MVLYNEMNVIRSMSPEAVELKVTPKQPNPKGRFATERGSRETFGVW